jgi:hypothetical protein
VRDVVSGRGDVLPPALVRIGSFRGIAFVTVSAFGDGGLLRPVEVRVR